MNTSAGPGSGGEVHRAARGGALSFAGAGTSALLGFLLTVVLARLLGDTGAGVVLQVIAVFTIAFNLVKLGTDTGVLWLVPRLEGADTERLRGALVAAVAPVAAAGVIIGGGLSLGGRLLGGRGGAANAHAVAQALGVVGWLVPCGALVIVLLAAIRALGGIRQYVLLGSLGLPAARLLGVVAVGAAGGGALAASLAWALPLPVVVVVAGAVLLARVRRAERESTAYGSWRPEASAARRLWSFSLPRAASAMLEKSLLWFDVLLVGSMLGSAAAGVYGAASRFVAAGLIAETALRVVVAPRFSALLAKGRRREVQDLYGAATTWVLLCSAPIYLVLAIFAPVVLSLLGAEFTRAAWPLAVLCAGMLVSLAAGNVQSVLLMSGRSAWQTANRVVVLGMNIALNVALIPVMGILGAAVAWAASMLLDAGLAAAEVAVLVRIRPQPAAAARAILPALVCFAGTGIPLRLFWGASPSSLVVAAVLGALLFAAWCWADRRSLRVDEFLSALRAKASREPVAVEAADSDLRQVGDRS
ncbi:MAG: lipopolysaccharide biosynthesis protein [Streptosporangiales bacterium]